MTQRLENMICSVPKDSVRNELFSTSSDLDILTTLNAVWREVLPLLILSHEVLHNIIGKLIFNY